MPKPKLIAISEDDPLVWVERCPSRLAAIRAGADECCGKARHFWARRRYMRQATQERAFRAYVVDTCEELADVGPTLKRYQLPAGLAEEVQALLEATRAPAEVDGA